MRFGKLGRHSDLLQRCERHGVELFLNGRLQFTGQVVSTGLRQAFAIDHVRERAMGAQVEIAARQPPLPALEQGSAISQ